MSSIFHWCTSTDTAAFPVNCSINKCSSLIKLLNQLSSVVAFYRSFKFLWLGCWRFFCSLEIILTVNTNPLIDFRITRVLWCKTRSFWNIKNSLSHERGSKRSEWAVRANERTDERVAQYLRLYSYLFQTTVERRLANRRWRMADDGWQKVNGWWRR